MITKHKEPPTNTAAPAEVARPVHTAPPAPIVALDQRVANLLKSPDLDHKRSSVFSAIIAEINAAITDLDWRSKAARERALDPTLDGTAERGKAEDLEFQSGRLVAGRARLQEYGRTAHARERLVEWHAKADKIEPVRDALAAELAEKYPRVGAELVDLFQRIVACNREMANIDGSHPGQETRRMGTVESQVQKIVGGTSAAKLIERVRLPALSGPDVWPLPIAAFNLSGALMTRSERRSLGLAD